MRTRWSHDGVRLEAPARFGVRNRVAAIAVSALAALGTAWLLSAVVPPGQDLPYPTCDTDPFATACNDLRPAWMAWNHTRESWRAARMCALLAPGEGWGDVTRDHRAVAFVKPDQGLAHAGNREFLSMVARQRGDCDTIGEHSYDGTPYDRMLADPSWRDERPEQFHQAAAAHADREYNRLAFLEGAILADRATRAHEAARADQLAARRRSEALQATAIGWMPALLLGSIALGIGVRRLIRDAGPVRIEVTTDGVRLDDVWIPRDQIAWIAIDGRRLRVQPWVGDVVFSRPLPLGALEMLDDLDAVAEGDERGSETAVPDALRDMTRRPGPRQREEDR